MEPSGRPLHILALASKNTGDGFVLRARERGARVWMLTKAQHLHTRPWRRDLLEDVFAEPDEMPLAHTIDTVAYLARAIRFDRLVPFGDFEVDAVAALREHLCLPGMGTSAYRPFRDKLTMRLRARAAGILVPEFAGLIHHDDLRAFVERVPPPWMLKPRTEAATLGIRKIEGADQLWEAVEGLGDRASHFLVEQYVPGDVHHVDSIVSEGRVVFAECHRNGAPPFDVASGGGIYSSMTMERGAPAWDELTALNERVLATLGLGRGIAHAEYIRAREDGRFHFLEAGARVGGAYVSKVVQAATGVDLWEAYADLEIDLGAAPYAPPRRRTDHAALVQCLARVERPDLSAYDDPEVVERHGDAWLAGLVIRSPSHARVEELHARYARRLAEDFRP